MNIITVVQARTTSSRLPHKVLFPLYGEPLLIRMIERVKKSAKAGKVVVATTENKDDDIIKNLCDNHRIDCYRGHTTDLLDRHYQVAIRYKANAVVKIPSDCPLIDPEIIDRVINYYIHNYPHFDYVSNLHPASYPDGNDVEIMSAHAIKTAWHKADRSFEREHTTPHIWENPEKFRIGNIKWETGFDYSTTHRWTIDYIEDYQLIKTIFEELYPQKPLFSLQDILDLIEKQPSILKINEKYAGRYWYENHLNDLKNIDEYKHKLKNNESRNYSSI